MAKFSYTIKDELGIHARPAGELVKEAKKFESKVSITKDGRTVDASKLLAVMSLGVKCGQTIEIETSGADEDAAADAMKAFFEANL